MHLRDLPADTDRTGDSAAEQARRSRVADWAERLKADRPRVSDHLADAVDDPRASTAVPYAGHATQTTDAEPFDMGMIFHPLTADSASTEDGGHPSADVTMIGDRTASTP